MEQRRKRQQRKACDLCRRRKVRCNIDETDGAPCAVCKKAGLECRTRTEWPAPRRGRMSKTSWLDSVPPPDESALSEPAGPPQFPSAGSEAGGAVVCTLPSDSRPPDESDYLARTGLSRFFEKGIGFNQWRVFEKPSDFRIAYVGTPVSNLTHLVNLRLDHASSHESSLPDVLLSRPHTAEPGEHMSTSDASVNVPRQHLERPLHLPYPQIRPHRTQHDNLHTILNAAQRLTANHLSFPEQKVRDALVNAFFDRIHPTFPILSRSTFLHNNGTIAKTPPILLYQAVLMAGVHVCKHPLVQRDRSIMKAILFRRAAMLFHLRHEVDRLHLTQAALLFTWHISDGDTVSGGYQYWSGVAMRVACGLGIHRHTDKLPISERILYKRTFWYAFITEVFSALETGRPCAIRAEDIDQSLPTQDELDWEESPIPNDFEPQTAPSSWAAPLKYHLQMISLAYMALEVVAQNAPGVQKQTKDTAGIDSRLAQWLLRSELPGDTTEETFLNSQLRLHYYTVILHLHRNLSHDPPAEERISSTAADSILTELECITSLDCLDRCHFTVVGSVTAAGIQLVHETRLALNANMTLIYLSLLPKLGRLLRIAKALSELWPHAEAVYNVFESMRKQYEQRMSNGVEDANDVILPQNWADWNHLFESAPALDFVEQFTAEQDWLNLTTRAEI